VILRELAAVEVERRQFDEAEVHARRAVSLDQRDGDNHAALAQVLEAAGRLHDAAAVWATAASIDPAWGARAGAVRDRARTEDVPAEIRNLGEASTVTRAQFATLLGTRLGEQLRALPARAPAVATDINAHWAAAWIAAAIEAGVMTVPPNRVFGPDSLVRRGDVAAAVFAIAPTALQGRDADLARWRAARPVFGDMPATHLAYRAAAFAVASGLMSADREGGFGAGRPATGAEIAAVVARIEQWAKR
jgi:hypothetical protein